MNTNLITKHDPEYDKAFWNAMKFHTVDEDVLRACLKSINS